MPQVQRPQERNSNGGGFSQKKKFGKNLNKLVKPAPPIPSDKADHNTKNGLLLLSTKKTSSGLLASKTNATISSGGAGSNGASIKNSSPSTHDALLSAVAGACQGDAQRKPDAWGVAEQARDQHQMQDLMEEEKNNGGRNNDFESEYYDDYAGEYDNDQRNDPGASWDEYGGRNAEDRGEKPGTLVEVDDQRERMSRLAKERAEIRSQEEEARVNEQKAKAAQRLQELDQKKGGKKNGEDRKSSVSRTLWEPEEGTPGKAPRNGKDSAKNPTTPKSQKNPDAADSENLIHVASYDDRDRGERGPAAAPRMLYDPKSGSMVEVKARAENGGGGGGGGGSENRNRNRRSRGKKERDTGGPEVILKNGRNKQKGRKESADNGHAEDKKKANPKRRFPRTCGVLYRRDMKGNLQTSDDCEGDLGYGAHSVPGGRIRNPEAYTSWKESSYEEYGDEALQGGLDIGSEYGLAVDPGLEAGFGSQDEEPQPVMEWVKADDKIELVTGVDDSPTLKPTAREFAPSQAAIAAAVAVGTPGEDRSEANSADDGNGLIDQEASEDEEDASEDEEDGLGFDPLQGIDFMSSSPTHPSTSPDDIASSVDLPSLALGQPMFDGAKADESALSRPLFAFGSSDTWGNSGQPTNTNGLSGWGSDPVAVGLFGSADVFRNGENEPEPSRLFSGNAGAWGPSSVLDRLPTINAEHAGPAD